MKIEATLSIGLSQTIGAIIEVDDDELQYCETPDQMDDLIMEYIREWSNEYIELNYKKARNDD